MESNLIGSRVFITDRDSIYYGEWGRIVGFDDDVYYIAIADGAGACPIFDRDQFKIRRRK